MRENSDQIRLILEEFEPGAELSQRVLAARLGVAVGRANHLVRLLIRRDWVRRMRTDGQRVRYVVTSAGAEGRMRLTREHLHRQLASYRAVRQRVEERVKACAGECARSDGSDPPAVVLYGTGEAAKIAASCMADLGVRLMGFVDDAPGEFDGLPVRTPNDITSIAFNGQGFDRLIVATLIDYDTVRGRLQALGFPLERVSWL